MDIIEQVGAPLDLYEDPDNRFVAGFIGSPGMNFMTGVVRGGGVEVPALGGEVITTPAALPADGTAVVVGLRPQNLSIDDSGDVLTVYITEQLGGVSYLYADAPSGERLIIEARGRGAHKPGDKIGITFAPETAMFFDAKSEARIR